MMNKTRGRSFVARAGVLALVAGGMTAIAIGPAQADTFTPGNTPPVVSGVGDTVGIQPTSTTSSGVDIVATIGDVDSLVDLDTVVLDFYNTAAGDVADNPQVAATYTWSRSTNAFVLASGADSSWVGNTPTSTYAPTNLSMTLNFKFLTGPVARQGGWTAKVTATDGSATSHSVSTTTSTVLYYSSITSRTGVAWGEIATAGTATSLDQSDGLIIANGSSKVTMLQTAFAGAGDAAGTSAGIDAGAVGVGPAAGKVALDCNPGATYLGDGTTKRLSAIAQDLATGILTTGTVEAGVTTQRNSCTFRSGGQLPVGEYTATVTTGIGTG